MFGGLAVSFGFSCGLGFVVAMAWCLVLVLGVVFWWWRRARVYNVSVLGVYVYVCLRVVWWLVCAGDVRPARATTIDVGASVKSTAQSTGVYSIDYTVTDPER